MHACDVMRCHGSSRYAAALVSVLLGCGEHSPSTPIDAAGPVDAAGPLDGEPGAPTVSATTPTADATDVERRPAISAVFSTEMAASTITGETFVVACDGAAIPGTVRYDGTTRTATFEPARDLPLLAACTATITTGARDASGTPLAAAHVWSFRVREGQWIGQQLIQVDDDALDAREPHVAIDGAGRALALWAGVWTNHFVPGEGWHTPTRLEDGDEPELAMDAAGNAVAVWSTTQPDDIPLDLWSRRFSWADGWDRATLLEQRDDGVGYDPRVAVDDAGGAVAVWAQYDASHQTHVWVSRLVPGTGWSDPLQFDSADSTGPPRVAMAPSGEAIVVWSERDGDDDGVWARRWVPGEGWSAATRIHDHGGSWMDVAMDPAGSAVVTWESWDGIRPSVWAARFVADSGWEPAMALEDGDEPAIEPDVAIDASGHAIVVWQRSSDEVGVMERRFEPGTGWLAAEQLDAHGGLPHLAMSPSGAATVVYSRSTDGASSLWARRFAPGAGWAPAVLIDNDDDAASYQARVVTGPSGDTVAVWIRSVGPDQSGVLHHVWANVFR